MLKDFFIFSLKSIRNRRIRSWLTMIGIFIGIAAVVALISLSQGMQDVINEQFKKIGANRIIVTPGGAFFGPAGSELTPAKLYEDDVDVVEKADGIEIAQGMVMENVKLKIGKKIRYPILAGHDLDSKLIKMMETIGFFDIGVGRNLKKGDKYKAVLGYIVAYDMFDKDVKVGDKIEIEEEIFEVVGIQKKIGTGVHDMMVRVPKDIARNLLGKPEEVNMIVSTSKEGFKPGDVAEDIKKKLRAHRNVEENEEDFSVQTSEQIIANFNTILNIVQAVLVGIASISLLVGGIGIMNTMYTSVLERRKEIGIMKAVGARNSNILLLFLIEAGIMGMVGGLIGIVIGIGISKVVELIVFSFGITMLKAHISFLLVIGALMFSFFVGSISGAMPARQAAYMQPVEALRKK